uniref:hexokinase n=1 Tax=Anas platyrhynchos platyrhynchos TaxID=8840 RepID=A0A493TJ96_ANAPP
MYVFMKLQQTRSNCAVLLGGAGRRAGPQGWTPPPVPYCRTHGPAPGGEFCFCCRGTGQWRYQRFHSPPAHPGCHQRVPPACCHVQPQAPWLPAQPRRQDPVEPPRGEGPPAPHQPVRVPGLWGGKRGERAGPPHPAFKHPLPGQRPASGLLQVRGHDDVGAAAFGSARPRGQPLLHRHRGAQLCPLPPAARSRRRHDAAEPRRCPDLGPLRQGRGGEGPGELPVWTPGQRPLLHAEKGDLMVVELCQSHVRTLFVTLLGDGNQSPQLMYKTFELPADKLQGTGEVLFDFVAQCVQKFLEEIGNPQHRLPVGFVFPFSCRQTGLGKAELISWSKGFQCSDVEGKDVVQLLQAAINKLELYHVEVIALLNDTVGTMMASSWGGKPCEIALVMGTGTNSCFMAEAQLVEVVEENNGRMCVNSEWGCFGDDGALNDVLTPYDHRVDQESSNPGERRFEKMVGGLYLGEIVRHAMLMLAAEQALFIGASTSTLGSKDAFKTQQVLEIMDNETGMAKARSALEALGLQPSERDCCRVQQICRAVVSRAAALSAMGLAAILSLMCRSRELERLVVNVGVDGELYRAHARFGEILQSVTGLLAPECAATLVPAADTNGLGVAMVTAVAQRMLTQRHEVEQLLAPLRLSRADLERVQGLMRQEMERGLGRDSNADASVRMLPTYVCNTPDGTERGDFLALDLGGTNFRVLVVRVMEEGIHMASEIYVI